MSYNVDIVMCIDATASMSSILETIKGNALNFQSDLAKSLEDNQKKISKLRVKVIFFRDLFYDTPAFIESDFFLLPEQVSEFKAFVSAPSAEGGGDEPESALEALDKAISSSWDKTSKSARHVVAVWTDAGAHPLELAHEKGLSSPDISKDINVLTNKWGQTLSLGAKRLLVFAPAVYPWSDIAESWDNATHYESSAGEGLSDYNYQQILSVLVNSIS